VTKVAIFADPDWSSTQSPWPPAGRAAASVIGPVSVRPALRRHSTALQTLVAAAARFSSRSRPISSASTNCSAVSSACQSSVARSAIGSTSQPTCSLPDPADAATASVTPPPCEAEIAMPSAAICGFPSPR
jgi:hypothetical protein